jgi:hypothetical protein
MAEERDLAVGRAEAYTEGDEDATKAELQRRMEEARESISQTVTEIKDTVTNQYQAVRQSVTEALDWREQYRKRPLIWSVGALSVGFIAGYSLGGAFMGDDGERYYTDYEEDYDTGAAYPAATLERGNLAAQPYTPQVGAAAAFAQSPPLAQSKSISEAEAEEPEKPGLIERFKETRAYDRLQEEVSSLGDRLLDELSNVGQTVVLPLIFRKIKELVGVDLSNKQQGQASTTGAGSTAATSGASATGGAATAGGTPASGGAAEQRSQASGSAAGGAAR